MNTLTEKNRNTLPHRRLLIAERAAALVVGILVGWSGISHAALEMSQIQLVQKVQQAQQAQTSRPMPCVGNPGGQQ